MRFGKSANILCSILMITLAFFIVLPVILVIILSFSSEQSIAENGYRVIPSSFSLDAYRYIAMNIKDLLLSFGVTLFITVTGSALSLFLISTMAFVLSRREFLTWRTKMLKILYREVFEITMVQWLQWYNCYFFKTPDTFSRFEYYI